MFYIGKNVIIEKGTKINSGAFIGDDVLSEKIHFYIQMSVLPFNKNW